MCESNDPSLYTIKAIVILDNDGDRLFAKYYDDTYPSIREQKLFEKNVFAKTSKADSEIALLEGLTVVYKGNVDLFFYVIGSSSENELMLTSVLTCMYDSISGLLRKNVEKRSLLRHIDSVYLIVDEMVDGGVIMEVDSNTVLDQIVMRGDDLPLAEQSISQVIQSAKSQISTQIKWSLLK